MVGGSPNWNGNNRPGSQASRNGGCWQPASFRQKTENAATAEACYIEGIVLFNENKPCTHTLHSKVRYISHTRNVKIQFFSAEKLYYFLYFLARKIFGIAASRSYLARKKSYLARKNFYLWDKNFYLWGRNRWLLGKKRGENPVPAGSLLFAIQRYYFLGRFPNRYRRWVPRWNVKMQRFAADGVWRVLSL